MILMIVLGLLSAVFTCHEKLSHSPNAFWIFLLIDLTINWKLFPKK